MGRNGISESTTVRPRYIWGTHKGLYTEKITSYMEEKSGKGKSHRVHVVGNRQHVVEVMLHDKGGVGIGRQEITMECRL